MRRKKTVFLTGSSGNMGFAAFKEFYKRRDMYHIVLLNRDSQKNRAKFADYENDVNVDLYWGDLTVYEDVLKCVNGADFVIHVGGMVSPAADYYPKRTLYTNVSAMKNIVKAVKEQENPDAVKVVYIGTVAETGDRNPPVHWGRTGDPIQVSVYDHYAISKTIAEGILADSGLRYWVSLRQTGIIYPEILNNMEPIMFHVPINGVLEWATVEDSGRLCAKVCNDMVPEEFWRRFYNISSGPEYRLTNYEFEQFLLEAIGIKGENNVKELFDPNWFILQNFHGQWYTDADELEKYLHFRNNVPVKEYFNRLAKNTPFYFKLSGAVPKSIIKKYMMRPIAYSPKFGTQAWIDNGMRDRVTAYYGSYEKYNAIGTWKNFDIVIPDKYDMSYLDHGYDETKPFDELTIDDMRKAAQFRGGECLADELGADMYSPIKWKCSCGHEFEMSPNLVLKGGHWCPDCLPMPWNYDEIAKNNPFFAQVWYAHHDKSESEVYDENIYFGFAD